MWEMLQSAWVGTKLQCPNCRKGKIFEGLNHVNETCSNCGVVFQKEEGEFIGAVMLAYSITSVLVVIGIFIVELIYPISFFAHVIIWSLFTVLFLFFTYRNFKGMWIGFLHAMMPLKRRGE